jgi:hypothetical protein
MIKRLCVLSCPNEVYIKLAIYFSTALMMTVCSAHAMMISPFPGVPRMIEEADAIAIVAIEEQIHAAGATLDALPRNEPPDSSEKGGLSPWAGPSGAVFQAQAATFLYRAPLARAKFSFRLQRNPPPPLAILRRARFGFRTANF